MKFKRFIAALEAQKWDLAVNELASSKWSKQVDDGIGGRKGRADRIAYLIRNG